MKSPKTQPIYDAVSTPRAGEESSEAAWEALLGSLKKWTSACPQSATARIAIADTYVNYAWHARGIGYADTVSNHSWNAFEDRLASAKSALVEASKLKEKSLYWYQVMFNIALGEGWDKAQA